MHRAFLISGLTLLGCPTDPVYPSCDDVLALPSAPAQPSWHRDVRPLVERRCLRCHDQGGLADLPLATYADASTWAEPAARAVLARTMPPWTAADCCRPLRDVFGLDPIEIATVSAWADAGAPEGDPGDYVPPPPPEPALPRVDRTLSMPTAYTPALGEGETDISRCFLLEWPEAEDRYVTGFAVRPGNPAIVHHVIALLAGPDVVAGFDALDVADPGPGWTCPGGLAWGATGWLGGWSPGWAGREIPDGLGHEVAAGSKVILSVHYSVVAPDPAPDSTALDLMLADSVSGTLESLSVYDPAWLTGELVIPPDRDDVIHSYVSTPTPRPDGAARTLIAANLHMHERGSRGQVAILHADGSTTCLVQIERWDYGWQTDYAFEESVSLAPDDQLLVECHFDNTAANQRVVDGRPETPRLLGWGDDEEMCVAFVTAAAPL